MRHATAVLACLALATPGCTIVGVGGGALVAASVNSVAGPPARIEVKNGMLAGGIAGLIVDIVVVSLVVNMFDELEMEKR